MNLGQQADLRTNAGQILNIKGNLLTCFLLLLSRQEWFRFTLSLFVKLMMGLGWSFKWKEGMCSSIVRVFHEVEKIASEVSTFCSDFKTEIVGCLQSGALCQLFVLRKWYGGTENIPLTLFSIQACAHRGEGGVVVLGVPVVVFKGKKYRHCLPAIVAFCKNVASSCPSAEEGPHDTPSQSQFKVNRFGPLD